MVLHALVKNVCAQSIRRSRRSRRANDAAVMKAYGFPPDLDEAGIVSRLFEMYARMVEELKGGKVEKLRGDCA